MGCADTFRTYCVSSVALWKGESCSQSVSGAPCHRTMFSSSSCSFGLRHCGSPPFFPLTCLTCSAPHKPAGPVRRLQRSKQQATHWARAYREPLPAEVGGGVQVTWQQVKVCNWILNWTRWWLVVGRCCYRQTWHLSGVFYWLFHYETWGEYRNRRQK